MSTDTNHAAVAAQEERGGWRPVQVFRAIELLGEILTAPAPADRVIEGFFRRHREMGSKDRGRVAEAIYACLRHRRLYETLSGAPGDAGAMLAVHFLTAAGWSGRALGHFDFGVAVDGLVQRVRTTEVKALPLPVRVSWPDWLFEALQHELTSPEIEALAVALNSPAPLDIRANTHLATRDEVASRLAAEGYPVTPVPWSPVGLRRDSRAPLFNTQAFRDGLFEVQDEGSQLVSYLLMPKRRQTIVDYCAGGGGKALHLGALMDNTGTVYACDINARRLQNLKPRLVRAHLDNIRIMPLADDQDASLPELQSKADSVLVDAPCSGTGTLRRNPDIKWRDIDLSALNLAQTQVLDRACGLVKPGGVLVYATCSLLRRENEDVVNAFLAARDEFSIEPAAEVLRLAGIAVTDAQTPEGYLKLLPHRHHTDGFFGAVLRRRK